MHERAEYHYFEDVNWGLLRLWGGRTGLRVLDVGCGFATTSARIQDLGNEVTGIDSSPEIEAIAAQRIARVIHGDVVDVDLGGEQFDAIIFADVLEHLPWPVGVLRRYLRWLKPAGSVIISLPNVGLWSVRLAHLFGRWEYDETGVLDRTHLRFFTRRTARWMIGEAGLQIAKTAYNPGLVRPLVPVAKRFLVPEVEERPSPDALLNSKPYRLYLKTAYPIERAVASLWPGMLAFQMIFEAKR
ncbi:MAG TPA: class I SAM-dependent methyltransferase [Thermoanaerobaculia bacterium]